MAFKKTQSNQGSLDTPETLYRDIKNRKIEGLISHQADILRQYHKEFFNEKDLALQLPTGSGKTLVGLLIGEWRRRKYREKVVYLCPTNQLANQVVEKSVDEYGIKANSFIGKQKDYKPNIKAEYINTEVIAVTNYSSFFNINTFFKEAQIIIFDDSHSAENYIAKHWSVLIGRKKNKNLFQNIGSVLNSILDYSIYSKFFSDSTSVVDPYAIEKVPTPQLYEIRQEFIDLMDEYSTKSNSDNNIKYSWSVLRDHFFACHVYISYNSLLIRPVIPPTQTHIPFKQAKQRIYMSATLGDGGELERLTGVQKITRLPAPEGWDKQGIGRRFFIFPEREFDEEAALNLVNKMLQETSRSLVLVPDNSTADEITEKISEATKYQIFNSQQIEKSKKEFISTENAVAVVANRYDGIDLAGEDCRLLIVKNIQSAVNLQEKFIVTRLAASTLLKERILTRIVQAVGRCTRSAIDYAAVVILGDDLNKILLDRDRRKFLHPELQAEIEFGINQSKDISDLDFIENLKIFLEHGEEWNEVDQDIVSARNNLEQQKSPIITNLELAVSSEIRYQYAIWKRDFEQALEECKNVLVHLSGGNELLGYRAFWYYLAGSAAWMGAKEGIVSMESKARDYFKRAASSSSAIPWLSKLSKLTIESEQAIETDRRLSAIIEGLANQLNCLGLTHNRKFDQKIDEIIENINQKEAEKFEKGHQLLGELLGYQSSNSDKKNAPDPWWIADDSLCIVFEDHSDSKENNPNDKLGAGKIRQAAFHPDWIKKYQKNKLRPHAEIIPVLITPRKKIEIDALPYTKNVCYWHLEEFRNWAIKSISVVRELRRSFSGDANVEWRKRAMQSYRDAEIDPESFVTMLKKNLLKNLST